MSNPPSSLEPGFFIPPRPKKSLLSSGPPSKKRKTVHKLEEISFDKDARADYLTGFHKRKVQRAKQAQVEAGKKEREEKIKIRKQVCFSVHFGSFILLSMGPGFVYFAF